MLCHLARQHLLVAALRDQSERRRHHRGQQVEEHHEREKREDDELQCGQVGAVLVALLQVRAAAGVVAAVASVEIVTVIQLDVSHTPTRAVPAWS